MSEPLPYALHMQEEAKRYWGALLALTHGNVMQVSRIAKHDRTAVYKALNGLGIDPKQYQPVKASPVRQWRCGARRRAWRIDAGQRATG